jgi:predicted adenine nucleotide alpha hydrolase (AANH) superfamily ATPase
MEKRFDIEFFYRDFRPLFERGREFSRAAGMYRQRYCGCLYSEAERFRAKLAKESGQT